MTPVRQLFNTAPSSWNVTSNTPKAWVLLLLTIMIGSFAMPSSADAGLLDWLFPRRAERQARRWSRSTQAYRPVSSLNGYTGRNTSYYGGNFAGGQNFGSGSYYPSYGSWNGWGYQSNVANSNYYSTFRPSTVYRTQWQAVPVTTYSPTAGGAYQTPSTNFEWQALRTPYTAFQPVTGQAGFASGASAGSGCSHRPVTSNFAPAAAAAHAATAWQPVAPAATTTAGFGSTTDYANATEWQPVNSGSRGAAGASRASEWQRVPEGSNSSAKSSDVSGATEWQPVGANDGARPADYAPRLRPSSRGQRPQLEGSSSRRETLRAESRNERSEYEAQILEQYERERDAFAREREALRRERELLLEERMKVNERAGWRRDSTTSDRYSDWQVQRPSDRDPGFQQRPVGRYDDARYTDRNANSNYRSNPPRDIRPVPAPATTYIPPFRDTETSQRDRQRSEFYNNRRNDDRNAYRPMLDDGWNYDQTDRGGSQNRNSSYDWRTSSHQPAAAPAPAAASTRAIPASMPNHRPAANGSTPRGVMPLLLRPIPESNDAWNTQRQEPKLTGPKDRTAALPTTTRWRAIPVSHDRAQGASAPPRTRSANQGWFSVAK